MLINLVIFRNLSRSKTYLTYIYNKYRYTHSASKASILLYVTDGQWCSGGGATGAIAPVPGSLLSCQFCLHLAEIGILIKLLLLFYTT